MAVYYYKGQPIVAPFTIRSNQPFWEDESVSMRIFRTAQAGQRWELSFSVQNTGGLAEFFTRNIDEYGTAAQMIMPQLAEVEARTLARAGQSSTRVEAGSQQVPLNNMQGMLAKGNFIQFANHNKIYLVIDDVPNPGTAKIYPALVQTVPNATAIKHCQSASKPMLSYVPSISTLRGISFTDGIMMDAGTIEIREVI